MRCISLQRETPTSEEAAVPCEELVALEVQVGSGQTEGRMVVML